MYNFGSPRVGNAKFVEAYNAAVPNSWRIANKNDVVTNVREGGACMLQPISKNTTRCHKW